MEFLKTFSELNKTNAPIAGGKGASLGEMTNAGIPVPPGFVVLSASFEKFLEETDLNIEIDSILEKVKHEDINTVEQASEKIQSLILAAKMPDEIASLIQKYFKELGTEYVAVRSSATAEDSASAAWAGQLDSFLNTTEKDLLEKVKRCWASLFTPRAIFYRFEQNLHTQKISVAVVVQKMVVSEVSGIAFSVHPVTQDYNQLIIETGFGLGEAIVSGQITPDSYVVEKEPRRIIDKNVAEQTRGIFRATGGGDEWRDIPSTQGNEQKISDDQILELSEIILGIENHYGFPCDIEWAYENGQFYIVQSRPITTLMKKEENKIDLLKEFTNKNSSIEHADGRPVYFEMTLAGFTDRLPNSSIDSYRIGIGHLIDGELDYVSLVEDQDKIGRAVIENYLHNNQKIFNLYNDWNKKFEKMLEFFQTFFLYKLEDFSSDEILKLSKKLYTFYREEISMPGFTDGFMFYAEKRLKNLVEKFCLAEKTTEPIEIFTKLTASIEKSFFNEKENELRELAKTPDNKEKRKKFLNKYAWVKSSYAGYNPYTEKDLEKDLIELPEDTNLNQLSINRLEKENLLKKYNFDPEIIAIVRLTDLFIKWQDQRKVYTLTYATLRNKILKEISQRFSLDFSALEYALTEELMDVLAGKINLDDLRARQKTGVLFIHQEGKLQKIIVGEVAENFMTGIQTISLEGATEISGTVASPGKVTGPVKIVTSVKSLHKVERGDILVAPMTRPEHLMGMKKAAAIVTDDGGITCHAAIVSRELNIPCIIGTKIATKILKDGDLIEVDANTGIIKILKKV
ncbi:MAG: PEP/pyruvate-binding domain-containing protein [Candidatus Uhrbacteria bacterium]